MKESTARFRDQHILVTGAGTGIGRATALAFGRQGARVIIGNRDRQRGQETVAQVQAVGAAARSIAGERGRDRE
jgi:NAD(P)-dependent dehydrogenase (short-subunit alcohol dehydrogenase family)